MTTKPRQRSRRHHRRALRPRRKLVWTLSNKRLTPRQRRIRAKSLEAVSLVRREKLSLREASKQVGLDPETVRANTNAFRKVHGRWKVKKSDRIPRSMIIYERGRKIIVEVTSSKTASLIGEYHNRIKQFLETGKSFILRDQPKKRFKDIKRKTHTLETNPNAVLQIKAREPTPEFFEIYRR